MDLDIAGLSDDELVVQLTTWAGRVAAGEALVLRLLGELDAREAWAEWGVLSCAHWASWRLGLTLTTAREKVRVARCLRELPLLTAQLGAGRVSYAQARAISRIATAEDEERWLELARFTTAAQLEKAVRGVGRATKQPGPAQEQGDAVRISWDEDGTLLLNLRISAAQAPGVLAALEAAQQAEQSDRDARYAQLAKDLAGADVSAEASDVSAAQAPEASAHTPGVSAETPAAPPYAEPYDYVEPPYPLPFERPTPFAPHTAAETAAVEQWRVERDRRRALRDAARAWEEHLLTQAVAEELPAPRANLADGLIRALTQPAGLKPVTVKLLIDPATGWARTSKDELLPPATLRQVLKTLPGRQPQLHARPLTAADLTRHDLGLTSRLVSPALRELLGHLDGERCRFPSCDRTTNLHAHHVVYWSHGGPTDLANLVLACARHHTLIHSQGFQLVLSPDRTLTVRTANDIPVPHLPALPQQSAHDLDPNIGPFVSGWQGDRFDLGYVVHVMAQHSS